MLRARVEEAMENGDWGSTLKYGGSVSTLVFCLWVTGVVLAVTVRLVIRRKGQRRGPGSRRG